MSDQNNPPPLKPIDSEFDYHAIQLGHLVKYNLYLLAKTMVFNTVYKDASSLEEAIETTNNVIEELDLDAKRIKEQAKQQESKE